jgi:Ser/Thr protein kinase RdoA (MazF antagonist)
MVLEDLVSPGGRFTNRLEPLADEHGVKVIEGLGRLHAHFWNDPRFDNEFSWIQPAMRGAYGATLIDKARVQFGDELPTVFTELCQLYVENHEQIAELLDSGERTLIHGDTHAGNQFALDGDVGLYDWAVISRSPGIRDVAIYLGNSCPTEIRRREEERWLRAYHQILVDAGVDAPAFDLLWHRYRLHVIYAWVAATTTASMGSRWQPVEVGRLGMTRATETCADLETIEAFRQAM